MFTAFKVLRGLIRPKYRSEYSVNKLTKLQNNFHTNGNLCVKSFKEFENRYAYNYMESKGYAISLDIVHNETSLTRDKFEELMNEDWSKLQPKQLFEIFSLLGTYCSMNGLCISNKIFDDFIDNLTDNIGCASDEELKSIFYSLEKYPETESIRTRNFIEVWAALDDACLSRINEWNYDQILQFLSLFFMLNITKYSDFATKAINKLATKAKQITSKQMVLEFFYVGVVRRQPFDMYNLELQMIDSFRELTLDDIAIISMGFFKSKTPIRSMELVTRIINKVIENPKDIHEVSLAAILKVIRYSLKINIDDKIYMLLDTLQHEVERLSIMCIVHMALLGTSTLTFHKDCLTKIAEKIKLNLSSARIKDLERLVLTYGTMNFEPQLKTKECLFDSIMNEMRKPEREVEINKHGRSFACCISHLGLLGKYPADLMSKVLSPEFLQNTYGKRFHDYGREILVIHNLSLIFHKENTMPRLSDKVVTFLAKKYTDFVPDEDYKKQYNVTEKMFLEVFKALKNDRGGSNFLIGDHILPHHQRGDIILCNSYNGVPLPVTDKWNSKFGLIKPRPDDSNWIVLIIAGRNTIIRGSNTPSGPCYAKIRELKALGYHGVLVPWSIYITKKSKEELIDYLNDLIKSVVN